MHDGLLIRITELDDNLDKIKDLHLMTKFFSDFTDFCITINEVKKEYNLVCDVYPHRILDTTIVELYTNEHEPKLFGRMKVQVCVNNETTTNELLRRIGE